MNAARVWNEGRSRGCVQAAWLCGLIACGGGAEGAGSARPKSAPRSQQAPSIAAAEAKKDSRVQVRGIEGTLSSYDVNHTMEERSEAFAACHGPRLRRVPSLSGRMEFRIQVAHSGEVKAAALRSSDVGDRALEQCFLEVVETSAFPRPNGGDADVTWITELSSARESAEPELWEPERVKRVVAKRSAKLREACELPKGRRFDVIAYVNRRGRVAAASVRSRAREEPETLDCIVKALRKWPMPRPRKRRWAKVSFLIRRSAG